MQLSNDDLSFKKESENEKKINVNLLNRKYNLIKLKNIYQEQINQMTIKIEELKKIINENKTNNSNDKNLDEIKNKINEVQKQNNDISKKTEEIKEESEKFELFFKNYFEKNNGALGGSI